MIVFLLIIIIAVLLLGAAYVRSCMVQIGALIFAAILIVEVRKRLTGIPEAAWWIGGFVVLFTVVCYIARQNHLQEEKEKAKASKRVKSLDEAIERERSNRQSQP